MKEAIVDKGPKDEIIDSPIPEPGPDVGTQVVVSGSNPKDWKVTGTWENEMKTRSPHGSYAEYARSPGHTTFHIPKTRSFEEAAAPPRAAMAAAIGLFVRLQLQHPFNPPKEPIPPVVYGAAGAVGAFAVQLAKKAGIRLLVCIAGNDTLFVEGLSEKDQGDALIDYRKGDDAVVEGIRVAVPHGMKLMYAFDAVSEKGSTVNISQVLSTEGSKITTVLCVDGKFPNGQEISLTSVASVHGDKPWGDVAHDNALGFAYLRLFGYGFKEGWLKLHPQQVVPGDWKALSKP